MTRPRLAVLTLVTAAALAGCGGGGAGGRATLWVTRDEGRRVLVVKEVPAGLTALQALERAARVETRYGGRFVESIDGLAGSLSAQRDWFYFVNGFESDRGAAEYRLHAGDVEWWDYRAWSGGREHVPVVVGAFPEPFLHGWAGKVRPAVVIGPRTPAVRRLARMIRATRIVSGPGAGVPGSANTLRVVPAAATRFLARSDGAPGSPVHFVYHGDPGRLLRDPALYRRRYAVP